MKTKNIFKAMALAMLMPAMLLTTACSSDDNTAIDNEQTIKKGFELPVTVNVTRQGDDAASSPTNRASYNGTSKKLEFSTGDQLFVWGHDANGGGAGYFAGTLTWQSGGTFSGTISIQNSYTGTIDDLFAAAQTSDYLTANLLPAGYGTYGYLSIMNLGSNEYEKVFNTSGTYTFATSKATGVEQFSLEVADSYSAGFALHPQNAILNFTITGLAASTNVDVALSGGYNITKTITTDGSGNATFAAGVQNGTDLNGLTLTVGGNAVTLTSSSTPLTKGHIYNITRSAKSAADAAAGDVGRLVGADGKIYASATLATAAGTTAVAMIAYVGSETGESAPYNHGLALALTDESGGSKINCSAAGSACSGKNTSTPVTNATWLLASQDQWNTMITAFGGNAALRDGFSSIGGTNLHESDRYWSSSESWVEAQSDYFGRTYSFYGSGSWSLSNKGNTWRARACLAF